MHRFLSINGLFKISECCILGPGSTLQGAMKKKYKRKIKGFLAHTNGFAKYQLVTLLNW